VTERYIFSQEAQHIFYNKLSDLHEIYVSDIIMCGADKIGTNIDSIKMALVGDKTAYCQRIVGGFQHITPDIQAALKTKEDETEVECILTYINDEAQVDGVYMIQNVYDYPERSYCLCSVWDLGETTVDEINILWSE
jgi:hypothetical protein